MADRPQIELDLEVTLECAEGATWAANELVGRTLETAVTGREAAATMHHAYSAQVHVARVLDWSKQAGTDPSRLADSLAWMRRARDHAEKLCRCFPTLEVGGTTRIAEWAERWPQDYGEAKSRAENSLEKITAALSGLSERETENPGDA
jgi:hypothetical protein